jgi:hypothetical protein
VPRNLTEVRGFLGFANSIIGSSRTLPSWQGP